MLQRASEVCAWTTRFVLAVILAVAPMAAAAAGSGPSAQFLLLSDIHFNPMADPSLVDRLAAGSPVEWPAILDASADKSLGRYGADTNWHLLRSTLEQMKAVLPHPAFVLITGDFLAHHFRDQFNAAARDHSDPAFRGFVDKTMRFLALEIETTSPNTPILPALGNNDEICGDFKLQPGGPFLADMLPVVRGLVGEHADRDLGHDWTRYGNYSATVPGVSGVRLIFANTVLFSPRYRNTCGAAAGDDPGRATLAWLDAELTAARRTHQRVWLAFHVPPGIDGFATWRQGSCPDHIIPMWADAYAQPMYALLRRYADTMAVAFAGHTHMDDFRLIGDARGNFAFALITPAVSPIFGQNPAFRTVTYDSAGGILDQAVYDLTNLSETDAHTPPKWQLEYTFTHEWQLSGVDLASIERLYPMITTVPADRALWHTLFPVSSPVYWTRDHGGADEIRAYDCATGHVSIVDFRQCWCAGGK
jgi:sphingomyelin phosphodiesterase acid-like 3